MISIVSRAYELNDVTQKSNYIVYRVVELIRMQMVTEVMGGRMHPNVQHRNEYDEESTWDTNW